MSEKTKPRKKACAHCYGPGKPWMGDVCGYCGQLVAYSKTKPRKPYKPRAAYAGMAFLFVDGQGCARVKDCFSDPRHRLALGRTLKETKRVHEWLGRWIKWKEAQ